MHRLAFCFLLVLGITHSLKAQITITNSVFPVVGDTLHYIFGNQAGAINQIFTPPGGPQTWNLSGLQASQTWNQIMRNPASGSAQASFPGASVLYNPLNSASQVYLQVTGTQVLNMGYFGLDELGLGLNLLFDKTPDLEDSWAPINFFDIHQSASNVLTAFDAPIAPPILLNLVPTADSFRIRVTYQRISSIDAFGTMTIPGGTFDVLRKKQTEYKSMAVDVKVAPLGWIDISTIGGQQLLPLGTDTITTFHFLNNVSKEAIAICTLNTAQNAVTGVQYKAALSVNAGPDQTLCVTTPAQLNATFTSGTPAWSVVSGPSTSNTQFSSTSNPQAVFTPAGGFGVYTLRFTVTDGMNSASDDVIITFNQASIINAGPDQTVCANDTIFLHAVLSGAATNMVWEKNVAFGVFVGSDTDPNAKFLLNATGKAQPFIRFGAMSNDPAGPCSGGVDTVTIFINSANAGPDQTLCLTSAPAQLAASGTGTWSVVSGPSTAGSQFSSTTNPAATFTPAGGFGMYTLRWTAANCTDDVKIQFDQPSIIDAGPDQTICANDTIFFHAILSGAATNMVWEKNVAFGVFLGSDTDPNAKFLLNANGRAQPFVRFGAMSNDPAGPCSGGVDTVTIFINSAGPDQTLCLTPGASAQLAAVGSGTWSVFSGPSTAGSQFSSTTNPAATFTPAGGFGMYTLRWTAANCTDDVKIQFDQASIIDAGPDQTICPQDTITFHATLSGAATNMVWEKNVAFGVFLGSDTDPNARFLLNANGRAQPFVRFGAMSNDPAGVCSGGVDTVTIFINSAGPDQAICLNPGASAQLAAVGSGTWSVFSGPSTAGSQFSSTTNPNATFTPAGGFGTYTLRWTTANCTDDVIIKFDQASIVDAGPDQTVCPNDTIFLHATLSGAGTNLVWEKNVAFGSFVGPDTSPDAKFVLNTTGKAQSSIRFGVMSNDPPGVCQGGVDTVTIFIRSAGPDQMLCLTPGASAQLAAVGSGTWSVFSGPSTAGSQFSSTSNPTATFTPAGGVGTYTLRWTTANCMDDVNIKFDSASIVDAGPDQMVCPEDTIFLHATLSGAGTNLVWQKNVAFGTFAGPDTSPDAVFILNANGRAQSSIRFGVMSNDPPGACQGGVDTVTIFLRTPIPPVCPPHMMVCFSQPPITLTGGTPAGGTYSGPGVSNNMFNPGVAGFGDHVITYTASDVNGCLASCTFIITVDNGVPIHIISNSAYCSGDPGPAIGVDPSFTGFQYQLQSSGGANLGAPVAGTGGPIYFGIYPNGTYRVVATSAQCTGTATATIQATATDCHIAVPNFCTCNSETGFTEVTVVVTAPPGMNWTLKDRTGFYNPQPPNLPMPVGTPMTYVGSNTYQLIGARTTNGFWVQVTNGFTDFDVMVGNASW